MKVLVACEYSGRVRDAFIARGHDAISADLEPTESPGPHYQGDVRDIIDSSFDLMIAHPPCTYLTNSGAHWLHRQEGRWELMREGALFFKEMLDAPIDKIAVENPAMHKYAVEIIGINKTQYVHPYHFGEYAQKCTGLWLKNLPPLVHTDDVRKETKALPAQVRQALYYRAESKGREKDRNRTFQSIANAMADQWG